MTSKKRAHGTANNFLPLIRKTWGQQVASIIKTGELLVKAKVKLGHGAWGKMFEGDDRLPFSQETARCLMAITRHPVLKSKSSWKLLPPSWWTLYILSRASVANLKVWLADGAVTCETTANEAQALYPAWNSRPQTTTSPDTSTSRSVAVEITHRTESLAAPYTSLGTETIPLPFKDDDADDAEAMKETALIVTPARVTVSSVAGLPMPPEILPHFDEVITWLVKMQTKQLKQFLDTKHKPDALRKVANFLVDVAAAIDRERKPELKVVGEK